MNTEIHQSARKHKDDRRNRRYHRKASATVNVDLSDVEINIDEFDEYGETNELYFGERLRGTTPGVLVSKIASQRIDDSILEGCVADEASDVSWNIGCRHTRKWDADKDPDVYFSISWKAKAERPSEIFSEEETLALVDLETIRERFEPVVAEAVEFVNRRNEQLRHLSETEDLSRWIAKTAQNQAKEDLQYEARLDALREEYEAKVEALKSEVKNETLVKGRKLAGEDWENQHADAAREEGFCDESIESAPKFWNRFVSKPAGGGGGGLIFRGQRERVAKIKPEDFDYDQPNEEGSDGEV